MYITNAEIEIMYFSNAEKEQQNKFTDKLGIILTNNIISR